MSVVKRILEERARGVDVEKKYGHFLRGALDDTANWKVVTLAEMAAAWVAAGKTPAEAEREAKRMKSMGSSVKLGGVYYTVEKTRK